MKYTYKLFTICFALLTVSACTDLDEVLIGVGYIPPNKMTMNIKKGLENTK